MNYNYHTHTPWCSHATGSPEEYILRAIECGIEYLGFSDHSPMKFPDGFQMYWRVQSDAAKQYVDEIRGLREKYGRKINIKVGFEMEYYPEYFDTMLSNAIEYGAEYLILGQHFITPEFEHPKNFHSVTPHENEDELVAYADGLVEAMATGVYTYVAHPDIFAFTGNEEVYKREMRKVCRASKEYNIPLELNLLGIRGNRKYPNEIFWKIAGEEGSPVTYGFDAHTLEAVYDAPSIPRAKELTEKYNLNYIGKPPLRPLTK